MVRNLAPRINPVDGRTLDVIAGHHSTGDFDFGTYGAWALTVALFISAPSALKIDVTGNKSLFAALKPAFSANIRDGQIESQLRGVFPGFSHPSFLIRWQGSYAASHIASCYAAIFYNNACYISYFDAAGARADVGSIVGGPFASDTWYRYRVTWWESFDLQNNPATAFMLERYVAAWAQVGSILYDTNRRFVGSATNRSGVGSYSNNVTVGSVYIDDSVFFKSLGF